MSLTEERPAVKVRRCTKCGDKLSPRVSSREITCQNNPKACEARAARKFAATTYTPPVKHEEKPTLKRSATSDPKFNDKLTFEHVLNAVCARFGYSSSSRAAMLSRKSHQEYYKARKELVYLLVTDLKVTPQRAADFVDWDAKSAEEAYQYVKSKKVEHAFDLHYIREQYPQETRA